MRALGLAACALALASCASGTDRSGLQAWLRLPDAQYISGALPQPAASGGPAVVVASVNRQDILPGQNDRTLTVSVDLSATGVLVGIEGDSGYWISPAGAVDVEQPGVLSFATALVFSPLLPLGTYTLDVLAVDQSGHAGQPYRIALHTGDDSLPDAGLAFSLSWDTESDLDLHVIDPLGNEVYWNDINSWTGPPSEYLDGGILDFDSNADCVIDGRRLERVVWRLTAPRGHYTARVDAKSLCGQPDAHWEMTAQVGDTIVQSALGEVIPSDTRGEHGRGAGVTALELDLP